MTSTFKYVIACVLQAAFLTVGASAGAAPITITQAAEDLVVREDGGFELVFDQSSGGTISKYYDLLTDPGANHNLATNIPANSTRYNGLFIIMFKQDVTATTTEEVTSNFRNTIGTIDLLYHSPSKAVVRVTGDFASRGFLYGASYDIVYTIESDPTTSGALIYIRSRILFSQSLTIPMQIRNALGLAHRPDLTKYSQSQTLHQGHNFGDHGRENYIGAHVESAAMTVDPVLILHRDWSAADYTLLIAPPKVDECLIAWIDRGTHTYQAGDVIENTQLLRMDQRDVTGRQSVASLAQSYRVTDGGDFVGNVASGPSVSELGLSAPDSASGATYRWDLLAEGKPPYIDRTHAFDSVPSELDGLVYLTTANEDRDSQDDPLVSFTLGTGAMVYVAHDRAISPLPDWLDEWTATGASLSSSAETDYDLYQKWFAPGAVELGPNGCPSGDDCSMYVVIVEESAASPPDDTGPEWEGSTGDGGADSYDEGDSEGDDGQAQAIGAEDDPSNGIVGSLHCSQSVAGRSSWMGALLLLGPLCLLRRRRLRPKTHELGHPPVGRPGETADSRTTALPRATSTTRNVRGT